MPTWEQLLSQLGPVLALIVLFFLYQLWPFLRDKIFPAWAKERAAERARDREFLTTLITIIQQNTIAFTELKAVVQGVSQNLTSLSDAVADTNEDLAAIFAHLKQDRPSRGKRTKHSENEVQQ